MHISESHYYDAFGLRLSSEVELPELLPVQEVPVHADVRIEYGDLSDEWNWDVPSENYYAIKDGQVLLYFPNIAIFGIQNGNLIIISLLSCSDQALIRLYLLGSCMGAILLQRRIFPLHGSAIEIQGKAYAFTGHSGAGKSTIAAALRDKGYSLLSDDVIAISSNRDGLPMVIPSYPQQKLWQESLSHLGLSAEHYQPLYQEVEKYAIPVAAQFTIHPVPLAGIFELSASDQWEDREIHLQPINRLQRLPLLYEHTYRNYLVAPLNLGQWHFTVSAGIAAKTEMYRLTRPASMNSVQEWTETVLNSIVKEHVLL